MAKKTRPILTISVTEAAPKQYLVSATFKDAPTITVDTKNPRNALLQVAMQAAIYLIMRQQGMSTAAHAPVPRELKALLKEIK